MQESLSPLRMTGGGGSRPAGLTGGLGLPWARPLLESLLRREALKASDSEAAQWYLEVLEDLQLGGPAPVRFALPASFRQQEGAL